MSLVSGNINYWLIVKTFDVYKLPTKFQNDVFCIFLSADSRIVEMIKPVYPAQIPLRITPLLKFFI